MKQKENEKGYTIEREFLAKVSVSELMERIIKEHMKQDKETVSE